MSFTFGTRSLKNLEGVHPDLVQVMKATLDVSPVDFGIIEGRRTIARQQELFDAGKSRTMNSRHLYGLAVDFAARNNGAFTFDEKLLREVADAAKIAALHLRIPIIYGGDWVSFFDGDHIELDRAWYPDRSETLIS